MLLLRREHEAIVNHQLCITNTFEQVFKEKMLKLYKKFGIFVILMDILLLKIFIQNILLI